MDWAKLNDWMQVVGIFALIASLLFVGLQLKQTREIALADQYQARAEAAENMFLVIQESGISMASLGKPMSQMTPAEVIASINVSYWSWTQYDNYYFQYSSGFLNDESWEWISRRIQRPYALNNMLRRPFESAVRCSRTVGSKLKDCIDRIPT